MSNNNYQNIIRLRDLDAVNQPIAEATGMPGPAYTSDQLFDFERDHLMANSWAGLTFASDVQSNGSVAPVDFMGLPLIVARTRQGQINVFHNVCSHRGMKLVSEAKPQARGISCPYHTWYYDLDGNLKSTPFIGGVDVNRVEGFSCEDNGLKTVRSHVWMGVVFINLSGDAQSFEDFIAPLEQRWGAFVGDSGLAYLRQPMPGNASQITVKSNWKLAAENFCESYHLPWIHPTLNTYSPLDQHYDIVFDKNMSGQGTYVYNHSEVAGTRLPQYSEWPEDKKRTAEYITLFPNVLLGLQVDHAYAMILQPQAADLTVEKLELYFVGEEAAAEQYDACKDAILKAWVQVFAEDIVAVEGMQATRVSPGFDGGVFSPVMDHPTHHFHKWLAGHYIEGTEALVD